MLIANKSIPLSARKSYSSTCPKLHVNRLPTQGFHLALWENPRIYQEKPGGSSLNLSSLSPAIIANYNEFPPLFFFLPHLYQPAPPVFPPAAQTNPQKNKAITSLYRQFSFGSLSQKNHPQGYKLLIRTSLQQ